MMLSIQGLHHFFWCISAWFAFLMDIFKSATLPVVEYPATISQIGGGKVRKGKLPITPHT